jgi:hypothetical protein
LEKQRPDFQDLPRFDAPFLVHHAPFLVHRAPFLVHRAPFLVHDAPLLVHRGLCAMTVG